MDEEEFWKVSPIKLLVVGVYGSSEVLNCCIFEDVDSEDTSTSLENTIVYLIYRCCPQLSV